MFFNPRRMSPIAGCDMLLYAWWKHDNWGRMLSRLSRLSNASRFARMWQGAAAWLALSIGLTLIPTILFIGAASLLLTGASINLFWSWVILSITTALAALCAKAVSGTWLIVLPMCLCVIAAVLLAHALIDTSYDGQEYHFSAAYALSHGWNPVRSPFPSPPWGWGEKALWSEANWVNHYPQSSWLSAAVLMAAGFDQETSKCATALLAAALFFALISFGVRIKLKAWKILLFAGAFAANPIIIAQIGTRMNDGTLAACFGLTVTYTLLWVYTRERLCAVGMCAALIFGLNLKFSAVPMFALLCAVLTAGIWLSGRKPEASRFATVAVGAACIAVFVLGFHPYLTNTIDFHHPFYPIMGTHPIDILSDERPSGFQDMPPWVRAYMSYFSRSGSGYHSSAVLKIPFSVNGRELNALAVPDARLGGFGPLFSGALVLTLVLSIAIVLLEYNNSEPLTALGAAGGLLAITVAMPEAWWARFAPYVWWIPGLVALSGLYCKRRMLNTLGVMIAATLLINSAVTAYFTLRPLRWQSSEVRSQIAEMRDLRQPLRIFYGNSPARFALIAEAGVKSIPSSRPLPPSCGPKILVDAYPMDAREARPSYCVWSSPP